MVVYIVVVVCMLMRNGVLSPSRQMAPLSRLPFVYTLINSSVQRNVNQWSDGGRKIHIMELNRDSGELVMIPVLKGPKQKLPQFFGTLVLVVTSSSPTSCSFQVGRDCGAVN